jgi:hypothetical protein
VSRSRFEAEADCLAEFHLRSMQKAPLDVKPKIRCRRRAYLSALQRHEGALPVLLSLSERHGMSAPFTRLVFHR